jgi:hypothetical protein
MKSLNGFTVVALALALTLGACGRSNEAQDQRTAQAPSPPAADSNAASSSTPPASTPSASMPPPASAQGTNSGETASNGDAAMQPMSKDEEAKAMPMPGQANDHSTVSTPQTK